MKLSNRHLSFGWWSLLGWLALGLGLEALHGFKTGWYLDVGNETRRLMFTLAHAHGTLLALINLAAGLTLRVVPGCELFEYDARTGKLLRQEPFDRDIRALAISPDQRWLAAAEMQRGPNMVPISTRIVLRDRSTLKIVREWPVSDPREAISSLTIDVPANDRPTRAPRVSYAPEYENGLVFSPDSKFLASTRLGTRSGIDIVDIQQDRLHASITVDSPCRCLEFTADGTLLASGHIDSTISVWDHRHPDFAERPVAARASPK